MCARRMHARASLACLHMQVAPPPTDLNHCSAHHLVPLTFQPQHFSLSQHARQLAVLAAQSRSLGAPRRRLCLITLEQIGQRAARLPRAAPSLRRHQPALQGGELGFKGQAPGATGCSRGA